METEQLNKEQATRRVEFWEAQLGGVRQWKEVGGGARNTAHADELIAVAEKAAAAARELVAALENVEGPLGVFADTQRKLTTARDKYAGAEKEASALFARSAAAASDEYREQLRGGDQQ